MRTRFYNILFFNVLLLFSAQKSTACGYDWVGDCSSSVHLRINGTLDSFDIADCPAGIRFNGLYLGTLQNLSLANARAITWESCINNVSAINLKYRVYEQGGGGGNFQSLELAQDYFTLLGPYTTRYRSQASNINLSNGLTVGKTYVLEVYFVADIDTIGDDFVPETTMLKNNNGQNYKLMFTYGGPGAHPFVVIPTTVREPKCHGESNGAISVSVWGDQTGLFYNWSNINLNFYGQNNLPAGTYTVTVTGANYAESQTVVLGQPDTLTIQSVNIQPVTCGGGVGSITVQPSGGTVPYHYLWSNGQTTATATFLNSGNYSLSLTDAQNCLQIQTFNLPGGGTVQQNISKKICSGESVVVSGNVFNTPGMFNFVVPGNGGCDTLINLTLTETNPANLLSNLPSNILVTCNSPAVNLCADAAPDATYQWWKDGIPAAPTQCLLATAGGAYTIKVTLDGCAASKNILSAEDVAPPSLFINTTNASGPNIANGSASAQIGGTGPFEIIWSTGEIGLNIQNLLPGTYCVTVTGANGCSAVACEELGYTVGLDERRYFVTLGLFPNPASPGDWLEIALPETFLGSKILLELIDCQGKAIMIEKLENTAANPRVKLLDDMQAGVYFVRVLAENDEAIGKMMLKK
ncbi:MAG: SprB repeat-containing protein [Phycisphaerae bacterium]|nr:SprB repeat-containing protein [Saprospiraceae bacterium]